MSKDSQFIFHFHGSVGQQIARVEKMVVNFDKDMNMHIEQVGEKQENTKHEQELFCCITDEAVNKGKAETVESELRNAASASARKLVAVIRTNEALGYLHTKHLSAQELFNLLNAHFGLDYGIRNFTKYRDKFSSI